MEDIEALHSSGKGGFQIFNLTVKAISIKQRKDSIEIFYGKMVSIWKEIDRMTPNPMSCAKNITTYNNMVQQTRLYQFLAGITDSLDKEKRDILNQDPLPIVDLASLTNLRRGKGANLRRPYMD